ncbi:hypothetical protein HQN82_23235 (plasmid) [Agrobacterium pusense]|nr:hypothetical protein HQN82_23235 [Agrobacterium pusense]
MVKSSCVASTGVFRHLTCPARKPKRENASTAAPPRIGDAGRWRESCFGSTRGQL